MKLMRKQGHKQLQDNTNNNIVMNVVKNKYYNMADSISKPIKLIHAVVGQTYKLIGPIYKNELYFKCTTAGTVMIKYLKGPGHDVFVFKGLGRLTLDHKKMEDIKKCRKK